jgi:SAM-dependent methyltransferase
VISGAVSAVDAGGHDSILMPPPEPSPEISDLIVSFDPETLVRRPVCKRQVVDRFLAVDNRRAARIVGEMPERRGDLDPDAVDAVLVRVHTELQRLSEEFEHGRRVSELLRPLLSALRRVGVGRPIRVVDIGCGLGYVPRWLAARGDLGPDVELIGADFNAALVAEARRLADQERLRVAFVTADAFRLAVGATVYLTTGVLHHVRGPALAEFFRAHDRSGTAAFVHFDFQPSALAPVGAWLFHAARFREPLARHDGVLSAARAHDGPTLVNAAKTGAPSFQVAMYSARLWGLPIARPFHTLSGIRPEYRDAFMRDLGSRAGRLGTWQ